ncbi:MAG: hypothetical protein KIT33_01045 [Candidatus Kapabacteria bacterium]|nr:hypothetical protein [Ignavibacteriota bacterium]MCW5883534.1 hypothetical protein [Candidatus Kapabacteria bacterium]
MIRNFGFILVSIFISSAILGCESSISSPKDIIFPETNVSYTAQVEPFLNLTCAFAGCHGHTSAAGIRLNDYFAIINSPGLVVPGNADGSLLNQILEERKPHFTYFEKSNITQNHITGMRQWVLEGARLTKD